ncbi:helix-turn-helix domain-containing protein [Dyadobacter psychrophilus]|uniref:Antitoxin component HigA of the HigAB toxin-antitoxin module, contains an N-terminal HTH domain n=1 Tax=Dyadobacter psychrophilus TaxID=651661 RepID=A0A1T5CPJ6_9BACT|nr:helix-turn-helix domain-containing protein [Dyadobacter psychrophilus]SKB61276.1 Antitoxin component HigA of the HigAB toxin-antitoxin module, contains an N-terminal HTH domain [Dyadobacter psychrophilus]
MIDKIRNETQYKQVMTLIEGFIQKATDAGGFNALNEKETEELHKLTLLAEYYEDNVMNIMPLTVTITAVVQQRINEMNITQGKLAEMFGMGSAKISQILNGKRQPDVPFLKAIHEKLGIDGNFILDRV